MLFSDSDWPTIPNTETSHYPPMLDVPPARSISTQDSSNGEHRFTLVVMVRRLWIPVMIFLLALAFRAAYLQEIRPLPDFTMPLVDAGYHDYWAWGMASGEWETPLGLPDPEIRSTPYFRPPLVAYWMAGLFTLFGHDHVAVRVVQILLGSVSCVLLYLLGRRIFDTWSGGLAGLLAASYWMLVYFDTEYREVFLLVFLYLCMMLALLTYRERPSALRAGSVGLALGLAVLAKPNGLLLLPMIFVWMWWAARAVSPASARMGHLVTLSVVVCCCVLPVTARNAMVAKDPVLVSSNGGINLFIGNNPTTNGTQVSLPRDFPSFDSAFDYPRIVHWIEQREGRSMSHSEASAWFTQLAVDHALQNPGATARMCLRKLAGFWAAEEIVSEKDLVGRRNLSRVLNWVPLDFASVFASAMVGLVLALAGRRRGDTRSPDRPHVDHGAVWLIVGFVAVFCLSFAPFFVTARYRAPVLPFLLIFSAFGVSRTFGLFRSRRLLAGGLSVIAMIGLYVLDHYEIPGYVYEPAKSVTERGALLALSGQTGEAEIALRESVELDPDNSHALNNLGLFLLMNGQSKEAVVELRKALEASPMDYRAHQNLGLALTAEKLPMEAMQHFRTAHRLQPLNPALPLAAGEALFRNGYSDLARGLLEQGLVLNPDSVAGNMMLGLLLLGAKDPIGAAGYFSKACQLEPSNEKAFNRLGQCYLLMGRIDQSVEAFERAVELAPDVPRFKANLERALQQKAKLR